LSEEKAEGHEHGLITKSLIEKYVDNFNQHFYVCGPDPMVEMVLKHLSELGVEYKSIVHEDL
jgi:NAD(P)H-flavin reductase